jgi:peroxiredoxin
MTLSCLCILLVCGQTAPVEDFSLSDVQGRRHNRAEWKEHKAIVLFFLGTECPVSNGYAPQMAQLAKEYTPKGVLFWGLHPDPDVTAAAAGAHAAEYGLKFPILLDPMQYLARVAGVRVVPEAVVLSAEGRVLYAGRIDDRYTTSGKRREEATTHDLKDALDAVLAGKRPFVTRTRAYGCPLPPASK